jgi:hypothetical protein
MKYHVKGAEQENVIEAELFVAPNGSLRLSLNGVHMLSLDNKGELLKFNMTNWLGDVYKPSCC